jgi:hypothetical protein
VFLATPGTVAGSCKNNRYGCWLMQKQPIWLLAHAKTTDIMQNSESSVETKTNTRFSNPLIKNPTAKQICTQIFYLTSGTYN